MSPPFVIELLSALHQRQEFACGVEALDRYLRQQVSQDVRKHVTACYVTREIATGALAGYYTLAAGSVLLSRMPSSLAKKLPRYPDVPVARLGRLAVDQKFHGQKLGAAMLWDAILRAARSEVVVYGLVVDAKDDGAVGFYRHHGFIALNEEARQLVLPLANLREPTKT